VRYRTTLLHCTALHCTALHAMTVLAASAGRAPRSAVFLTVNTAVAVDVAAQHEVKHGATALHLVSRRPPLRPDPPPRQIHSR
jgi:hypothetical protein